MKPKQYPVHQETSWLDPKFTTSRHILAVRALPFFVGLGASRAHRPRSVTLHYSNDWVYSHASVGFYCGNSGFAEIGRGRLMSAPPDQFGVCGRCEAAALEDGHRPSSEVAGVPLMIIPTKKRNNTLNAAAFLARERANRQLSRLVVNERDQHGKEQANDSQEQQDNHRE